MKIIDDKLYLLLYYGFHINLNKFYDETNPIIVYDLLHRQLYQHQIAIGRVHKDAYENNK